LTFVDPYWQFSRTRIWNVSVKIRMKKMGRKNRSYFRVCAMDIRSPRDGRVIEELGTYDPAVPETDARAILNGERISYWLGVGAQASPKVSVLIKKYGKNGSHLDAQAQAISRLGQRRAKAIQAAIAAAAAVPPPAPPAPATESVNAAESGSDNAAES
jgi:small subunit ribosomal protein S16